MKTFKLNEAKTAFENSGEFKKARFLNEIYEGIRSAAKDGRSYVAVSKHLLYNDLNIPQALLDEGYKIAVVACRGYSEYRVFGWDESYSSPMADDDE